MQVTVDTGLVGGMIAIIFGTCLLSIVIDSLIGFDRAQIGRGRVLVHDALQCLGGVVMGIFIHMHLM